MGTINIDVPGEVNLKFKIENREVINKIIRIIKNTGTKKKMRNSGDDIVGIWKDRFNENIPSGMIQRELREKTWKRF